MMQPASPAASAASRCEEPRERKLSWAPRVTKKSGTKKPSAMPRSWPESRSGSPAQATTTPAANPATRMLVPKRSARAAAQEREQRQPQVNAHRRRARRGHRRHRRVVAGGPDDRWQIAR